MVTLLSPLLQVCVAELASVCFNWFVKRLSRDMVNTKGMSSLSTYDFSILNITFPLNLIKEKLTEFIEPTFNLACNQKHTFFTSEQPKRYNLWSCQKMCEALHYSFGQYTFKFVSKLFRHIEGIPVGTNCVPLVADFVFVLLV